MRAASSFEGAALELGGLLRGPTSPPACPVRPPVAMLDRHGLVTGGTGTGKTKTLQLMAEQLSAHGVPVVAADVTGDPSGLAEPGEPHERIDRRAVAVGQQWTPTAFPVELWALGGAGTGVPIRVTTSAFGPPLLSTVLGLNQTQQSSLGLVFHDADRAGLSKATAAVILGELVSLVRLPAVPGRPEVFSTFPMWLLADLFHDLPEVGDVDEPSLVFFLDEAHLLVDDASGDFVDQVVRAVRPIRSKGVGVVVVTQSPTDLSDEVLAQLGSRVQHQLRAHTPRDAAALRGVVFPTGGQDDLGAVITGLGTGEAVVTVLDERGAPTPVAWTLLRVPESRMGPADPATAQELVESSPRRAVYPERADRASAPERLAERLERGARSRRPRSSATSR